MIAKLTGILDDFGPDWAVIDVGGVGYLVQASAKTLGALGLRGETCVLHTEMQVSENDIRLILLQFATMRIGAVLAPVYGRHVVTSGVLADTYGGHRCSFPGRFNPS